MVGGHECMWMEVICYHWFYYFLTGNSISYRDASTRFGSVSGSVFLDQLSCSGTESVLLDCRGRPLGLAQCNTDELAGVQCTGEYWIY